MNTLMTGGRHLDWKEKTARLAAQGLSGQALDVATGTGDRALALARCPGIAYAVGIDLLPHMVARARSSAPATSPTDAPDPTADRADSWGTTGFNGRSASLTWCWWRRARWAVVE